jgi:hypothetical protein
MPATAGAQATTTPPEAVVAVPSVSVILPNYNSVPIGEVAGLEAGAFVARANDSSAGFYNTAGLARAARSSISGGAGVFEFGSVSPDNLSNAKGTFQQIPAMFGVVVRNLLGHDHLAGGFSLARVNAWSQVVEAETVRATGAAGNRFRFSTDASFDSWIGSLGVAYQRSDRLRLGMSLDGQYTWSSRRQSIDDQFVTSTGLNAVSINTLGSTSTSHLRATLAGQFEVTPAVHVGMTLRTPGLGITGSGSASIEGLAAIGRATASASYFDHDASVQYKLPLEVRGGVAWLGSRAQVEVDVFTYTGRGVYDLAESDVPILILSDNGQGGPPGVSQRSYVSPIVHSRAVVNLAAGGHYQLTDNGAWVVHGGYATDRSPVGDLDTTFTRINLQKFTVGLSGRTSLFLGSVGLQYTSGRSDTVTLGRAPNGSDIATRFDVSSLGVVYSVALLF